MHGASLVFLSNKSVFNSREERYDIVPIFNLDHPLDFVSFIFGNSDETFVNEFLKSAFISRILGPNQAFGPLYFFFFFAHRSVVAFKCLLPSMNFRNINDLFLSKDAILSVPPASTCHCTNNTNQFFCCIHVILHGQHSFVFVECSQFVSLTHCLCCFGRAVNRNHRRNCLNVIHR